MILDDGVMADVVAAPHDNVVADGDERLDCVVLEDEAVLAAGEVWPGRRLAADVTYQPITALLGVLVFFRPQMVHPLEAERNKQLERIRRIVPFQVFESDDRQALELRGSEIVAVDGEGYDIVRRVVSQIEVSKFRPLARPEHHDPSHARSSFLVP